MLDVFSGLGVASEAMRQRGWDVVTVDNNADFSPDIVADALTWRWEGPTPDLVWCSPPCDEFSREFMPWSRTGKTPDRSLVRAARQIIREARPRYWVIENVRGSVKWLRPILGSPRVNIGPYYLWGYFPDIGVPRITKRNKESMSSTQSAERARIPYEISLALAVAIESQMELLPCPST